MKIDENYRKSLACQIQQASKPVSQLASLIQSSPILGFGVLVHCAAAQFGVRE